MLIAEIHGKRFPEAEGQEDWLTSAVFGHLRHIAPGLSGLIFLIGLVPLRQGYPSIPEFTQTAFASINIQNWIFTFGKAGRITANPILFCVFRAAINRL